MEVEYNFVVCFFLIHRLIKIDSTTSISEINTLADVGFLGEETSLNLLV